MDASFLEGIDSAAMKAANAEPPLLELYNTNRESIGKLELTPDGFLTFDGDVDESAKKFFEAIIARNSSKIIQYRATLNLLKNNITDPELIKVINDALS